VSVVRLTDGVSIATVPYAELLDPRTFVSDTIRIFRATRSTPERGLRKGPFDYLFEVGETYLALCVLEHVVDDAPYRKRLKVILEFAETGSLDIIQSSIGKDLVSLFVTENPPWRHYHLLQCVLASLGLSWIGYLDVNPFSLLNRIFFKMKLPQGNQKAVDHVISLVCSQIDKGKPTIGLDVEMMIEYGDLVPRIKQVLVQRLHEIANATVAVNDEKADLSNLWLTSYGYDALKALGVGTSCSLDTFAMIKREFRKHNIGFKTSDDSIRGLNNGISFGMREYLWRLAREKIDEFSIRPWILVLLIRLIMRADSDMYGWQSYFL
jgi:hypothetical protein